jgi:hypothetical protein
MLLGSRTKEGKLMDKKYSAGFWKLYIDTIPYSYILIQSEHLSLKDDNDLFDITISQKLAISYEIYLLNNTVFYFLKDFQKIRDNNNYGIMDKIFDIINRLVSNPVKQLDDEIELINFDNDY